MLLLPAAPCKRAKIGLAILSRWHDRRFGWTGETLKIGIEDLLDRGYLPPPATVPMFAFRVSWDHVAMLRQSQKKNASARSEFGALKIRIIPGDTGNSDPTAKCGSSSTGRSPSRMDSALSARRGSPSTATWCPTTSIPVVWRCVERRSSGKHSSCPLVVQRGKGIEQRVTPGHCVIAADSGLRNLRALITALQ